MPFVDSAQEAEYRKAYYLKHREKLQAYQRNWYLENKEKHNARMREWARANPEWVIQRNKREYEKWRALVWEAKDKPCTDCGVRYPPWIMQFDDRDPSSKAFTISEAVRKDIEVCRAEMAKCDIVCANCHAERTWQQLQAKKRVA